MARRTWSSFSLDLVDLNENLDRQPDQQIAAVSQLDQHFADTDVDHFAGLEMPLHFGSNEWRATVHDSRVLPVGLAIGDHHGPLTYCDVHGIELFNARANPG